MRTKKISRLRKLIDLTDRVAVVTGGTGLLGAEFCRTLVESGAQIIIADIDEVAASALAESISSDFLLTNLHSSLPTQEERAGIKERAIAVKTDVTDPISVQNMVYTAQQAFSRLDILVNCAALDPKFDSQHISSGHLSSGAFEDFPLEAWNQALAVNLTGVFLCCQAAIKPMLVQGGGVIVNLSSIYGLVAPDQRMYQRPDQPPQYKPVYYTVTKFGILGLTRYLAAYYGRNNIRVNALSPGGVYNDHDDAFLQAYSTRTVLGRMAKKDEINGALLFLVSDASTYMTGANLVIDGGWTTW